MEKWEEALAYNNKGYNWAQSVFAVFANDLNLDKKQALALSSSFGGGVHHGGLCGAVLASTSAIGLLYGNSDSKELEKKKNCKIKTEEFLNKFISLNQQTTCENLLGYNFSKLSSDEQLNKKEEKKCKCQKYIKDCVQLLYSDFM